MQYRKGRPDLRGNLRERSVGGLTQFLVEFYVTAPPFERVAEAIAETIGQRVDYRPVESDGAARAAALIAPLL